MRGRMGGGGEVQTASENSKGQPWRIDQADAKRKAGACALEAYMAQGCAGIGMRAVEDCVTAGRLRMYKVHA